jgi:hypothetical protein
MEVRIVKGIVNALVMFITGMVFMSRIYCINLNITSGPMYIGWDTVAVTLGGLLMIKILMWFDPSFKED